MDINNFKKLPIIGILRGVKAEAIEPLTDAIISSGLKTIEITMNTPDAPKLIRQIANFSKSRISVGAGTVLTMDHLHAALDSGATFIVMPVLVNNIVEHCVKNKIPVFPGALTPQEVYNAWASGATMVKIFPAGYFGPSYFKELKGPFKDIELLACGGVNPENIKQYFDAGASAAAFGASIFKKEWLEQAKLPFVTDAIKNLIFRYRLD
jgi:2-dehydro-3-deoxyphosphogluconate aldolase/(4S)-4-hydroxy-2-oxoglutarate aldolase